MQFAFTVSLHIIFPAFTIGLASWLAVLNALWLKTGDRTYLALFEHWKKIFAVAFGMGVVSGIVMSYQFGTNWSVFSDKAGPVVGPLMAYEVLSAFFLEAGFLGIMLFGRQRVGNRLHMVATLMVALGTLMSAFWILSVNSWMQTPQGHAMNEAGQFVPMDWWAIVFNPSFPYRLLHMVLAAYLTTAFVVGGVGALHLLRDRSNAAARRMFSMAMWMAAVVTPMQIVAGDLHGLNTLEHQPAKVMAMEGHYQSHPDGAPLYLFGIPNGEEQRLDYALGIPQGLVADPEARSRRAAGRGSTPCRGISSRRSASSSGASASWSRSALPCWGSGSGASGGASRAGSTATAGCTGLRWRWHQRFRRRAGRLGDDGGGAPALYRLRPAAHGRQSRAGRGPAVATSLIAFIVVYSSSSARARSTCCG